MDIKSGNIKVGSCSATRLWRYVTFISAGIMLLILFYMIYGFERMVPTTKFGLAVIAGVFSLIFVVGAGGLMYNVNADYWKAKNSRRLTNRQVL